ncbi:MAG: hypothetical protein ACLTK0_05795 [Anaerovoracaceae bacterium]
MGLPPTLVETYGSEVKKTYRANGVPLWAGFAAMFISAFLHLATMCAAVILLAPVLFGAVLPPHLPPFCVSLAVYIISSLFVGSLLGLAMKNQAKLTMIAQLIFLPSIMLSGIMLYKLSPAGICNGRKAFAGLMGLSLNARRRTEI